MWKVQILIAKVSFLFGFSSIYAFILQSLRFYRQLLYLFIFLLIYCFYVIHEALQKRHHNVVQKVQFGVLDFSDISHLIYYQLGFNIDYYYFVSSAPKFFLYFFKANDYGNVFSSIFCYIRANIMFTFRYFPFLMIDYCTYTRWSLVALGFPSCFKQNATSSIQFLFSLCILYSIEVLSPFQIHFEFNLIPILNTGIPNYQIPC